MKYFTMDELNDISNELLNNPSRETLRFLNDKYNRNIEANSVKTNNVTNEDSANVENIQTTIPIPASEENNIPKVETPIWQPAEQLITRPSIYDSSIKNPQESIPQMGVAAQGSTLNIPTLDIQPSMKTEFSQVSTNDQNKVDVSQTAGLQTNQIGISNNSNTINPVPFNGNLWESQENKLNDMMQTTDNFNSNIENEPNNNINNNFFNPLPDQTSSSIPIYETQTQEGPTMFGQFEQNFSNDKTA